MMDANGEWAPPSAKDVRMPNPDLELARRFSRTPSARGRALLLGMDWEGLREARFRLVVGAWVISGIIAVADSRADPSHPARWNSHRRNS